MGWLTSLFRGPGRRGPTSLATIVGKRVWVGDGECVDAPGDYERVVRELVAIGEKAMAGVGFVSCVAGEEGRVLTIGREGKTWTATLLDDGWIDAPPLLACLNEVARAVGAERRYFEHREEHWGQELGVFFGTSVEALVVNARGVQVTGRLPLVVETRLQGMAFEAGSELVLEAGRVIEGTLVAGQRVAGMECREVRFAAYASPDAVLAYGRLVAPFAIGGVMMPAGSEVHLEDGKVQWVRVHVPLVIGELAVPAESELQVEDGRIASVELGGAVRWRGEEYGEGETIEL